jgi:hypothetical protein
MDGVTQERAQIVAQILNERRHQDELWGEQNHPDVPWAAPIGVERLAKAWCDRAFDEKRGTWGHIALEEMGEVIDAPTCEQRRAELVQLAAVCMAWVEAIDRRSA